MSVRPKPDQFNASDDLRQGSNATSTPRWRRWKERQDRGEIIAQVPVDYALIELMLDAGKINERDSRDRRKVTEAILRLCYEGLANALDTTPK